MRYDLPEDLSAAAKLGGEMGRRFASFDWLSHPLGSPAGWSERWRGAVTTALTSRFPIVLWLGRDMRLVYNDAYLPVLGEKHPASLGAPGRHVWRELWEVIGPMLEGVLATGVATWADDLMLPVVTADQPQERYFTFTYSPLIAGGGGVDGIFCAVTETTERVIGARRLEVLNDLAAALIDAPSVESAVATTLEVSQANPADLPSLAIYLGDGQEPASLRGATSQAHTLVDSHPIAEEAHPTLRAQGGGSSEILLLRGPPDGPEHAVVQPIAPTPSLHGAMVIGISPRRPLDDQYRGFCARFADQFSAAAATAAAHEAERRRAEALAQLDAAKTAFVANVSHEFRTPLTLLLGPIEEALASTTPNADVAALLDTAHRNGRRLLRMVNTLLDFTRIEAGQPEARLVTADVGGLTAGIASSFADVCRRAGIDLVLRCGSASGDVDLEMWETVVLNLVSNAFKFTLEGTITVTVSKEPSGEVALTVADTGVGIARDDLGRIFDRFYRPSGNRGRSVEGSGIGLALVHNLVTLMNGTIAVESDLGVGTTVTVRLPSPRPAGAAATAGSAGTRAPASKPEPVSRVVDVDNAFVAEALGWLDGTEPREGGVRSGRPVVLVADDNADMRRHLLRILGAFYDVEAVGDGGQALERARHDRPDLIVTDVMMPALDGLGLVAALRADPRLATIPIVMLSARAGIEAEAEGLSTGSDDYLAKPFRSADLLNRVQAHLAASERMSRHSDDLERAARAQRELAAAVSSAGSPEDVLAAIFSVQLGSIGAPGAALGVIDTGDELIRVRYVGAVDPVLANRYHVVSLDAPEPIAAAIREDRPIVIPDRAAIDDEFGAPTSEFIRSVGTSLTVPVHGPTGVVGTLVLFWPVERSIGADDVRRVEELASPAGSALARLQTTAHEHRLVTELQDRLLTLDAFPSRAVVRAVYQSASEALRVGGDWFTATTVDADRLAISVGDVVGHGIPAVATMSQLRSALTSAAISLPDPKAALDLVDRYARTMPDALCATIAYAVFDHRTGSLSYACAGHPYPLLVDVDGRARFLEEGRRAPLGASSLGSGGSWAEAAVPPGSLLLLYTDGLVERRGESLDTGLARLADIAAGLTHLPAGEVCDTLLAKLAPDGGFGDDVALMALRPAGETTDTFVDVYPAAIPEIRTIRYRLHEWLDRRGISRPEAFDVLLAVGEAVNNAIEHGSRFEAGQHVTIEAFVRSDATLSVTVGDRGRWSRDSARSRRTAESGRGLTLMHALSNEVKFVRGGPGTRVTLTFPLASIGSAQ